MQLLLFCHTVFLKCNLGLDVMPLIPPNFVSLKAKNSLKISHGLTSFWIKSGTGRMDRAAGMCFVINAL